MPARVAVVAATTVVVVEVNTRSGGWLWWWWWVYEHDGDGLIPAEWPCIGKKRIIQKGKRKNGPQRPPTKDHRTQ